MFDNTLRPYLVSATTPDGDLYRFEVYAANAFKALKSVEFGFRVKYHVEYCPAHLFNH